MKDLVLGVDGTRASASATQWVAERCVREPSRVRIVNVIGTLTADRHASLELLERAERVLRDRVPGQAVELLRADGAVSRALARLSAGADLLVIGVDPDHPVRAAIGGWVPVRVVARASVPVCVVPAGWTQTDGDVVVGLADDTSSAAALDLAAREASATTKKLHVVHAWALPGVVVESSVIEERPDRIVEEHRALLDAAVRSLQRRFTDVDIESDVVRSSPVNALLGHAERAALIVIGTHHQGVLAGGLTGAVAQDLLWRARCPVLIVPEATPITDRLDA
ncbi:nucleotide-binding universal stress UspA family protein [Microbacterium sp. AG1240]|uniref:universal stress protein n=1 Tax=Microbacterium sp. AG1240 TaxID=2183992 RepID=UPI000EABF9A4|nr:universal stress protein [Microbacterium sp. AG1240]RKT31109.1 nucleotide-binding universal stress UspA family protein [Microbacterium sp. AG1240]